jgi:hypothetical protein
MNRLPLLFGLAAILVLLAVERLVSAAMLGFVTDNSRSLRLGIAFICAGLAPLVFAVACFEAFRGNRKPPSNSAH